MLTNVTKDGLNPVENFERISEYFKKVKFDGREPDTEDEVNPTLKLDLREK